MYIKKYIFFYLSIILFVNYIENMVLYKCLLCNYSSNIKSHYNRHLNSKKHKNNIITDEGKEEKKYKKDQKKTILGPFSSEKETILGPQKDHFCQHCNKGYKYKTHLYRHLKHSCKV